MVRPYYIASFSGGKDSTAMLLHMIELDYPIDEVLNVDTGLEFPEMYEHIRKVRSVVEEHGLKFTVLKSDKPFTWYLYEKPIESEKYGLHHGYGWPTNQIRWCTKHLKLELLRKYLKDKGNVIQYIGLAADEMNRLERANNTDPTHRHPLAEWGWAESDALKYCYDRGYDWGGLYEKCRRVSCWCCPLSSINSLKMVYRDYPDLWKILEGWEEKIPHHNKVKFKDPWTVADLAHRFERELKAEREQTKLSQWGLV